MEALTDGSPTTYATPKATSPAIRPASKPLTRKSRAEIIAGSVAGEAEQVTPIMDPLMNCYPAKEGDRTLLGETKYQATKKSIAAKINHGSTWLREKVGAATATRLGVGGL